MHASTEKMMTKSNNMESYVKPNIIREKKMVEVMVKIYCQNQHHTNNSLCESCIELEDYGKAQLDNCRYQEKKPVCGRCGLKCYNAQFKNEAERMFTYAGPRFFFKQPPTRFTSYS